MGTVRRRKKKEIFFSLISLKRQFDRERGIGGKKEGKEKELGGGQTYQVYQGYHTTESFRWKM